MQLQATFLTSLGLSILICGRGTMIPTSQGMWIKQSDACQVISTVHSTHESHTLLSYWCLQTFAGDGRGLDTGEPSS